MPTNLTGSTIASTYDQLLHVDGGPTANFKATITGPSGSTVGWGSSDGLIYNVSDAVVIDTVSTGGVTKIIGGSTDERIFR